MATELERIAILEERTAILPEMHRDLKIVVAYVNQQKGRASVIGLVWTGIIALVSAVLGGLFSKGHH